MTIENERQILSLFPETDWLLSEKAFLIYAPCMYHATYEDFKVRLKILLSDPAVKIFVCEDRSKKTGMLVSATD